MIDKYILKHLVTIIKTDIYVLDEKGRIEYSVLNRDGILDSYVEFISGAFRDFPCMEVDKRGIARCVMWVEEDQKFVAFGMVGFYKGSEIEEVKIPYCDREIYVTAIALAWKILNGEEIEKSDIWLKNIPVEKQLANVITRDLLEYHEEGKLHNPYMQEVREMESIRLGDVESLRKSINENYDGEIGRLATDDLRNAKNLAICVISGAARSAIKGGVQPEMAFSMSDTSIRYIEDELTDPILIEQVTRQTEFNYAKEVNALRKKGISNSLIMQVKDYVFKNINNPILVRDIAKYVGVSANYLSEQFSQSEGITLKQYILDEKIKSSEYLLKYMDYSLQEISSFCAFSSQSRFSVYFQRKHGITPAKFRKMYKKERKED